MRVIGYIEHPQWKITAFKSGNRFVLKFEDAVFEQTYKFREGGLIQSFKDLEMLVDLEFLSDVKRLFKRMHLNGGHALKRKAANETSEPGFDQIV